MPHRAAVKLVGRVGVGGYYGRPDLSLRPRPLPESAGPVPVGPRANGAITAMSKYHEQSVIKLVLLTIKLVL